MRQAEKTRGRVAQMMLVAMLSIAPSAGAVSLRRQCREACTDLIAACVASGERSRVCRRQILRQCREQGVAFCQTPEDSGAGSRAAGGALSLLPPSSLGATATSSSTVALRWVDTNSRESGYLIERTLDPTGGFTVIATLGSNATSYNDAGLVAATTYFYRVRAYGRKGSFSLYSGVVSATTLSLIDAVPPSVPTGLGATPVSCSQINIGWAGSTDTGGSGLGGYNVFRNGAFLKQVFAPATSTSDAGLPASTGYTYTVSAFDTAGNASAQSTSASAFTPSCGDTTPPTTPTNLSAVAGTCGSVNLAWLASVDSGSGLKGYRVYRNGGLVTLVMAPSTAYTDIGLTGSTSFTYAVSAVDNAGNESSVSGAATATTPACSTTTTSPSSSTTTTTATTSTTTTTRLTTTTTTATTSTTTTTRLTTTTTIATTTTSSTTTTIPPDTTPPFVPSGLGATATSCSQTSVGWNATSDTGGSGLKGYNVYRNGTFLRQVLAPATSTTDAGLAGSAIYSYAVSAVDNAGNTSSLSATASTNTPACPDTTPPSVPTGVTATAASCSQVNLAWNASTDTGGSGLKGYNLYRGGSFVKQVAAPATSTSDGGLVASTGYIYTLAAVDNAGNQSSASGAAPVTTPTCAGVAPSLMGYVPGIGTAKDVVVAGTRAYVASGEFGLAIADISVPSAARAITGANPPFYGDRVAVDGTLAVASTSSIGMTVLDLSDPTAARVVGTLAGPMRGVALAGRYAYALSIIAGNPSHTDLVVVDLAVPSTPTVVGRVTTVAPGGTEIALVGSVAYVVAGTGGLQMIDVSSPTAPRVLSTFDTPDTAWGVAAANGYVYVADGSTILVVDARTPSQPVLRGTLATSASALAIVGTKLYVVDGLQFKVVDVSNPAAPTLQAAVAGYDTQRVAAAGNVAYLASANVDPTKNKGGLYVMDVSSPTAPRLLLNVYGGFDNWGVGVSGTVGVVTGNSAGLEVVDLSTPASPRVVGTMAGTMKGVVVSGRYAYALQVIPGNPSHTDLVVVDLGVPSAPAIVGRVTTAAPGGTQLALSGSVAYVVAGLAGLQTIDVSSPTAPRVLGTVDTPGSAWGVAVANGYAYVADGPTLLAIDVRTPSQPVVRGTLATSASAVATSGSMVYAVDGMQLKVVDATNPAAPTLVSATAGYGAAAIDVSGTLAFLVTPALNHLDRSGGLYVMDVSTASQPRLVKQVILPGTVRSIEAGAGMVFVGDAAAIVDIVELGQ
jgi:hypothetical protein